MCTFNFGAKCILMLTLLCFYFSIYKQFQCVTFTVFLTVVLPLLFSYLRFILPLPTPLTPPLSKANLLQYRDRTNAKVTGIPSAHLIFIWKQFGVLAQSSKLIEL